MSQLILVDHSSQREIGRRPMRSEERYQVYRDYLDDRIHARLLFQGCEYVVHHVEWQVAQQVFVVSVTCDVQTPVDASAS